MQTMSIAAANARSLDIHASGSLATGHSVAELLEAFPALDERRISLAKVYAEANPARGRPKPQRELPASARIVRDRRVARRRQSA
ncbi:hypothetical protein [Agrobacterium vitis]|uniref:hypothetical protein n=1 Tax=Agrobacterium vitis TaxID=373 RepID=UPI0018D23699|nr:hypothetical protein [Agrobacterium vitis]